MYLVIASPSKISVSDFVDDHAVTVEPQQNRALEPVDEIVQRIVVLNIVGYTKVHTIFLRRIIRAQDPADDLAFGGVVHTVAIGVQNINDIVKEQMALAPASRECRILWPAPGRDTKK